MYVMRAEGTDQGGGRASCITGWRKTSGSLLHLLQSLIAAFSLVIGKSCVRRLALLGLCIKFGGYVVVLCKVIIINNRAVSSRPRPLSVFYI